MIAFDRGQAQGSRFLLEGSLGGSPRGGGQTISYKKPKKFFAFFFFFLCKKNKKKGKN